MNELTRSCVILLSPRYPYDGKMMDGSGCGDMGQCVMLNTGICRTRILALLGPGGVRHADILSDGSSQHGMICDRERSQNGAHG